MSFANLFTSLSAVDGDATHRNQSDDGKRGNGRKRKPPCQQTGPDNKKHRYEAWTSRSGHTNPFNHDDSMSVRDRMPNIEHASTGFTKEEMHKHIDNTDYNFMHHKGQNHRGKNNRNVYKQQQQQQQQQQEKMVEGQESLHRPHYRGRGGNRGGRYQTRPTSRRGGGDRKHGHDRQFHANTPRSMTQEFKEQNALSVDGQLLCRHFLWGRCIKGDECQLKHIQGYNDLVKEACKFYIQGLCSKGESCPYMHKSFPCKFFHRKGICSQGEDCKFSHEPLNETTGRLLEEALKREKDLYELAKKAQQESPGQPATPDESEVMEENRTPDVSMQQLSFYNSGGTNAEQDASSCETKELCGITETAVPPEASDSAQPRGPLSAGLNREEPVCYSVEAVLGPQLFKPFPSFFTTPGTSPDYLPSSGPQTSTTEQSKAPYSVDADNTVRSRKSVGPSASGHVSTPLTVQSVFYTPKSDCEELADPLPSSEAEKLPYSLFNRIETNKPQERMFRSLPALHMHTDPMSKTRPDVPPAQRAYCEGKLELLQSPTTVAETSIASKRRGGLQESTHLPVNCKGVLPFAATKHRLIQTFTPTRPTPLRPRHSGQTSDSQASVKTFCASPGFSEFKGPAALPAEPVASSAKTSDIGNSVIRHFTAKQPTETHQSPEKPQSALTPGTQRRCSTETTAECGSRATRCDDSVGCSKTQRRSFHNLFAGPIADSLKPTPDILTPAGARGFIQASCPAPQSTQCKGLHVQTAVEPDKASATSFLCLFAAPLGTAPPPCMQSQPDYSSTASRSQDQEDASRSSDSKHRASNSEMTLPQQDQTDVKQTSRRPTSPKLSPCPKNENEEDLSEAVNQPAKQQENPVRGLVSDSLSEMSSSPTPCGDGADPSTTRAHRQLPDVSSPKRSAVAASANSVLKTLFLCLDPFVQDAEQRDSTHISVPPESEQQEQSCVSATQQGNGKKKGRRKKKTEHSHQQSAENSTEHQPQTSVRSLEATVGSTLSLPAGTEPQERNSGTHNLPFIPATQLTQLHAQSRLKNTSQGRKTLPKDNGNVAATPLKDIFKTLGTFNSGH